MGEGEVPRSGTGVRLHVAVELLLAVLQAVSFALERAHATQTLVALGVLDLVILAIAQDLDQVCPLDLLFEALLQAVIGLFAFFDSVNCHGYAGS